MARKWCSPFGSISSFSSLARARLGKKPIGIRPIGIGDIFCRAAATVVVVVVSLSAITSCDADQLCAGLKAGVESGVHAVSGLWAEMDKEEEQGFLLIDAENVFNSLPRVNMLRNVRHLWPKGARFAFNLYCFANLLICRSNIEDHFQMQSKERSIQGCPLSMFLYGIGVLPLIRKLKKLHPDVIQPCFVDDAAEDGRWQQLELFYEELLLYEPGFWYFPNSAKYKVVVHPNEVEAAELFFNTQRRSGFEIYTGTCYIGKFIGTKSEQDNMCPKKC